MTQLSYSGSVPMNRNYPKIKNSPNRRPHPSANTTPRFTKPNFSMHTGNLIEVLYGRHNCHSRANNITLLCTYFSANKRHNRFPNRNNSFVKNETSNDNFYSDKRKLCATAVENETSNRIYRQQYDEGSAKINATLKDLGFVSENDRMYTMHPSKINYYNVHKHNNTGYSPNSYNSPKPKNSIGYSDGYIQKPIPSKTYPENNSFNKNEKNQNHHQNPILQNNNSSNQLDCSNKPNYFHKNKPCPNKYWAMRYLLFSKFDHGIILDTESFYSVCPEVLSYHIAKRCRSKIVCDPFCGAGGNIIQLAFTCKRVIAIDIDPNKIELARHNAEIYGVAHKIEFIVGDFFLIYPTIKADVVFMSPPWGGPEYSNQKSFSIESMCNDHFGGGFGIFHFVKKIAPNIAFHMPKTTNILECMWLARDFGKVEIQQNIINGRLNSITAFYGEFYKN